MNVKKKKKKKKKKKHIYTLFLGHCCAQIVLVKLMETTQLRKVKQPRHDLTSIERYFDQSRRLLSMALINDNVT